MGKSCIFTEVYLPLPCLMTGGYTCMSLVTWQFAIENGPFSSQPRLITGISCSLHLDFAVLHVCCSHDIPYIHYIPWYVHVVFYDNPKKCVPLCTNHSLIIFPQNPMTFPRFIPWHSHAFQGSWPKTARGAQFTSASLVIGVLQNPWREREDPWGSQIAKCSWYIVLYRYIHIYIVIIIIYR